MKKKVVGYVVGFASARAVGYANDRPAMRKRGTAPSFVWRTKAKARTWVRARLRHIGRPSSSGDKYQIIPIVRRTP